MNVMLAQTKIQIQLNNAELFFKLYSEQKIANKKYYEETRELEK